MGRILQPAGFKQNRVVPVQDVFLPNNLTNGDTDPAGRIMPVQQKYKQFRATIFFTSDNNHYSSHVQLQRQ